MTFPRELELVLGLDEPDDDAALRKKAAQKLGVSDPALPPLTVLKRSIDARRGRILFRVLCLVSDEPRPSLGEPSPREVTPGAPVVVVGDGPAGLFCAYELARHGIGSIVLDRGKTVQPRRHDLKALHRGGVVDENSNYCFGEGGAGTYSDGKLYTRSHKRGSVRDVIEVLALHGAPERILVDARPHVGSNRLPKVITAIRERLERAGVVFQFGAKVVDLLVEHHGLETRVVGVKLSDGREVVGRGVVLATGHSARDVWLMLHSHGATLEPKSFAMGVRIEHPQKLIDSIQYGRLSAHPRLPAASYRLAHEVDGRGVFSFCMCPGGFTVPASTEPSALVVNGMSLTRRAGAFSSSGLVVGIDLKDMAASGLSSPWVGVELQKQLETAAFVAGGGRLVAPAARATDFVLRRASSTLPETSYIPGLSAVNLGEVLDSIDARWSSKLRLAERIRAALKAFDRSMRGYVSEDAVLIGVESRTSAPVRVARDPGTFEAIGLRGLFPIGEGAGHAGGIVSAAVDGIRAAQAIVKNCSSGT